MIVFLKQIQGASGAMENYQDDRKPYYVVQFIDIPFEGIANYVCVPYSWVVMRRVTDKRVAVAYPHDEDPFDTRDRVKRKEKHHDEWKIYMAKVKFEADSYKEAEYWIALRKDCKTWTGKNPRRDAAQTESTLNSDLQSSRKNHPSRSTRDKPQLTPQIVENLLRLPAKMSLKRAASSSHKHTSSQTTSRKRHLSSSVRQEEKQLPSLPTIDVDGPTEVISIAKGPLQGERQASKANGNSQSNRASNTTTASMTPPQPSTSVEQPPPSVHHDDQRQSQDRKNLHSNFQPIITEVRSVSEADNKKTQRTDEISSNVPYASRHLPSSLKSSARLYSQMNERPSLHESVEKTVCFANSERLRAIAAQNSSNLEERQEPTVTQNSLQNVPHFQIKIGKSFGMNALDPKVVLERIDSVAFSTQHTPRLPHQRPSFVRQINRRQSLPPLEQSQQQSMDVPDELQRPSTSHSIAQRTTLEEVMMHEVSTVQCLPNPAANQPNAGAPQSYQINLSNFHQEQRQELRRTPPGGINPSQPTLSGLKISIPAFQMISTNIANQTVLSSASSQHPPHPPQYYRDMQHQPHASEPQVGIPINTNNDKRLPPIQGVTQRSPPYVQPSIPNSLHLQRLEASLQEKPIDHDPGSKVQNITLTATGEMRSLVTPSCSSQQSRRELLRSDIDNACQPSLSQQLPINQPPQMSMQRVLAEDNIVNRPSVPSPSRSADHVRQADKRMEVNPVSPDQGSSSDSEFVVNRGVIPEQETITSNTGCAGTSGLQSSTSADNQPHTRIVLEEQMLEHFSTLFTQMGSTLYYSCEVYQNLRGSILETADTYKKLMEIAERFNASEAAESAASFTSNVGPRILPLNEERPARVAKRASPSNHSQHSSRVGKEPSNKKHAKYLPAYHRWKIVLPAEYDPNDSGWTLKYRKMVPNLQELLPGRGIYVNSTKLMYAERVSGDCKTLAPLVLEEVFSETALIVCSTWHETKTSKKCWIKRPPLDPVAWDALLNYVLRYGIVRDWNIDTGEIIKAMDNKIYEIRVKHNVLPEPYSP